MSAIETEEYSWDDLRALADEISSGTVSDQFVGQLFDGIFDIAMRSENPIRGNLCAAALRELVGHFLHTMAPDDRVRSCKWFVQAPNTSGPTRAQRVGFIVHAGLTDEFVRSELGIDPRDISRPLVAAMEQLNRATHVRANTIVHDEAAVQAMIADVLHGIQQLLEASHSCRSAIEAALQAHVDQAVFEALIGETIQELDELSTHTTVDGHQIDGITLKLLDEDSVVFSVVGTVFVQLQYGSNSDLRNDIGVVLSDSYPYSATLSANAWEPMKIAGNAIDLRVDNSAFYE